MIVYAAVFAGVLVLSLFSDLETRGSRRPASPGRARFSPVFDFPALVLLVLFSAVRHGVGTDYWYYRRIFETLDLVSLGRAIATSGQELGPSAAMWLLRINGFGFGTYLLVMATLTIVPVYYILKTRTPLPTLGIAMYLFLGYYGTAMNQMRQALAMTVLFVAIALCLGSARKFATLTAVAMLAHLSAGPAGLSAWLVGRVRSRWQVVALVALGGVALIYAIVSVPAFERVAGLINESYSGYLVSGTAGFALGSAVLIASRLGIYVLSRTLPVDDETARLQGIFLLSLPFAVAGLLVAPIGRIELYFSMVALLLIPMQIAKLERKGGAIALVVVACLAYFLATIDSFNGLVPYVANWGDWRAQ